MNESNQNPNSVNPPSGGPQTGKLLQDTRLAAKIDLGKISSDLRLAPQVITALEKGEYHLLPGDPYIRALLGSMGRYLNLDPQALIASYNQEIGAINTAPSIAPYKDRAHTYTTAHKQIFVAVFLGLFIVLFLLIGKINKGQSEPVMAAPVSAATDSVVATQDTGSESRSLAPDSSLVKPTVDSISTLPKGLASGSHSDTGKAGVKPIPTVPPVPAPGAMPVAPSTLPTAVHGPVSTPVSTPVVAIADTSTQNVAIIKPLIDSVGIKVLQTGKEDYLTVLRLGKQMRVSNTDTIVVYISKRKAVEVTLGGKSVIPGKKRFKIYGNTLKAF
jgi:cytoskeletal protein RodZ